MIAPVARFANCYAVVRVKTKHGPIRKGTNVMRVQRDPGPATPLARHVVPVQDHLAPGSVGLGGSNQVPDPCYATLPAGGQSAQFCPPAAPVRTKVRGRSGCSMHPGQKRLAAPFARVVRDKPVIIVLVAVYPPGLSPKTKVRHIVQALQVIPAQPHESQGRAGGSEVSSSSGVTSTTEVASSPAPPGIDPRLKLKTAFFAAETFSSWDLNVGNEYFIIVWRTCIMAAQQR